ncbi:hypothetical protein ACFVBP_28405 [Nocardioides sp. NPDC057764]|uniref:hypothetical protein n=1 Tax=Nocardioides sp. NPDC057764 TaxID=3346243 RepID=UPI00366FD66A
MHTLLVDQSAPGLFRATCSLALAQPRSTLTREQLERAEAEHWTKCWDRAAEVDSIYVPCEFETTDRAAYAEHMKAHGKRMSHSRGYSEAWAKSIRTRPAKLGHGLGLTPEGKPFRPSTNAIADTVKTCSHCGLIAELAVIPGRTQDDLRWWREHLEVCKTANHSDAE